VFFPVTWIIIIEHLARFIEEDEKARRIINSPFCWRARCPEEDSGRTREVIAAKYIADRPEESVEFLSMTILGAPRMTGREGGGGGKKN